MYVYKNDKLYMYIVHTLALFFKRIIRECAICFNGIPKKIKIRRIIKLIIFHNNI